MPLTYEGPEEFLPAIEQAISATTPQIAELIKNQSCFAHLWKDESGICPEVECVLRTLCKQSYENTLVTIRTKSEQKDTPVSTFVKEIIIREENKAKEQIKVPKHGKYKKTTKYKRHGYISQGRPVDELIASLVHELGYPYTLPKNWSPVRLEAFFKTAQSRLVMAKTASYHSFMVDGMLVCRFWTNAAGYALVDLNPTLVGKAQAAGFNLYPVLEGSKAKLRPCTTRIYCENTAQAELIAIWIKEVYSL